MAKQNKDFYAHFLGNPDIQIQLEEFHASHLFVSHKALSIKCISDTMVSNLIYSIAYFTPF